MLFQFVNVLLQVLVHKSHDLLQEEIGIATYNMASVDFDGFYSAFLPEFLASCDGVDSNQKNVLGRNFKMDRVRGGNAAAECQNSRDAWSFSPRMRSQAAPSLSGRCLEAVTSFVANPSVVSNAEPRVFHCR